MSTENNFTDALREIWEPAIAAELNRQVEVQAAFEGISPEELRERIALAQKRARRLDRRITYRIRRITARLVLTWKTLLHGEPQDWDY